MKHKTFKAAAICLATTALVALPAFAAVRSFDAQTGWRLSKQVEGGYCTITQKFMDGVILSFARNIHGERSLALDFPDAKFDTSKEYMVRVAAGSGSPSDYAVAPVSAQALVIGLGPGAGFERNLLSGGQVEVSLNQETYRLQTGQFAKAVDDLAGCTASLEGYKPDIATTRMADVKIDDKNAAQPVQLELKNIDTPKAALEDKAQAANAKLAAAPAVTKEASKDVIKETGKEASKEASKAGTAVAAAAVGAAAATTAIVADNKAGDIRPPPTETAAQAAPKPIALADTQKTVETPKILKAEPQAMPQAMAAVPEKHIEEIIPPPSIPLSKNPPPRAADFEGGDSGAPVIKRDAPKKQPLQPIIERQTHVVRAVPMSEDEQKRLMTSRAVPPPPIKAEDTKVAAVVPAPQAAQPKPPEKVTAMVPAVPMAANEPIVMAEPTRAPANAANADTARLVDELNRLQSENRRLQQDVSKNQAADPQIAKLQQDVGALLQERRVLQSEMASIRQKIDAPQATTAARENMSQQERTALENLEREVARISAENRALRTSLEDQMPVRSAQASNQGSGTVVNVPIGRPTAPAVDISEPIEGNFAPGTTEARYAEAQREIRRLGRMLEQEKVLRQQERKELEGMLFDPQVANSEQLAELKALEAQLDASNARIRELEGRVDESEEVYFPVGGYGKPRSNIEQLVAKTKGSIFNRDSKRKAVPVAPVARRNLSQSDDLVIDESMIDERAPRTAGRMAPPPAPVEAQPRRQKPMISVQKAEAAPIARNTAITPPPLEDDMSQLPPVAAASDNSGVVIHKVDTTIAAAPAAVPPQPLQTTQMVPAAMRGASDVDFWQTQQYQRLFKSANVPVKGAVKLVDSASTNELRVYSWESGNVFGMAEQRPIADLGAFDQMAQAYLERFNGRCKGDFAAEPSDLSVKPPKGVTVQAYDIACAGKSGGTGGAILFFVKDGVFTAIAHEGAHGQMAQAMDIRDNLAKSL